MRASFHRAGLAVTGLLLAGLAIAAAVALVTAPLSPRLAVAAPAGASTPQPSSPAL